MEKCVPSSTDDLAVETLYAQNSNPIISLWAREGIQALAESLPSIVSDPTSQRARERALYGAWLCALCLSQAGTALHHKICHAVGGAFDLPHSATHTIVLPHALAYNAPAVPAAMAALALALPDSRGDAIAGLNALMGRLKVGRRGLRDLKGGAMGEAGVDHIADVLLETPFWNPRELERDGIREVVRRCWAGEEARVDL